VTPRTSAAASWDLAARAEPYEHGRKLAPKTGSGFTVSHCPAA
jgi:hypothetical protein